MASEAWGVCGHTIKRATGIAAVNSTDYECSRRLCHGVCRDYSDSRQPVLVMDIRQMHLETATESKTEKNSRPVAAFHPFEAVMKSRVLTFVQSKGAYSNSKHDDVHYNTVYLRRIKPHWKCRRPCACPGEPSSPPVFSISACLPYATKGTLDLARRC